MASVQEMETKIAQLERKLDFVMNVFRISQPSPLVGMPPRVMSLFDLYLEASRAGLEIQKQTQAPEVKEGEVVDGGE